MSARRSTNGKRCPGCRINARWCFCESLTPVSSQTFLSVIMHKKETLLTSNTSTLALKMMENSEVIVRGEKDSKFHFEPLPDRAPLYLFPSEDAQILTKEYVKSLGRPVQLVVPDSTWRQAKKFHKREPALNSIPRVKLPVGLEGLYTLRKSPVVGGVCTLEAIAEALGIIEGDQVKSPLLAALKVMNRRVEISRNPSLWSEA